MTSWIFLLFFFSFFFLAFNRPLFSPPSRVVLDIVYFQRSAHVTANGIFLRLNGRVGRLFSRLKRGMCKQRLRKLTRCCDVKRLDFASSSLPLARESPYAVASRSRSNFIIPNVQHLSFGALVINILLKFTRIHKKIAIKSEE